MNTEDNNQNEEQFNDTETESEELDLELESEEEEEKITMTKAEWEKHLQTLGSLKRQVKDSKKSLTIKETQKPSELLNNADLNYLDLKGVTESEDVKVVENFMRSTGKTAREAFRDEYVTSRLATNKTNREVQEAMPSGSKRGGNQANDLASAIAKYEATGVLPTDFKQRSDVINAFVSKGHNNKPSWQ